MTGASSRTVVYMPLPDKKHCSSVPQNRHAPSRHGKEITVGNPTFETTGNTRTAKSLTNTTVTRKLKPHTQENSLLHSCFGLKLLVSSSSFLEGAAWLHFIAIKFESVVFRFVCFSFGKIELTSCNQRFVKLTSFLHSISLS